VTQSQRWGESRCRQRQPQRHQKQLRHYHQQRSVSYMNDSCRQKSFQARPVSACRNDAYPPLHFPPKLLWNNIRMGTRCIQSLTTTTDNSHQAGDDSTHQATNAQSSTERSRPKKSATSDPTAKRPTPKCDPYGLQGESLSHAQCVGWLPTLEDGWRIHPSSEDYDNTNTTTDADEESDNHKNSTTNITESKSSTNNDKPTFLQKQYYHATFHEASQFLSHITLLATNLNHYPYLSMERILVDDLNNVYGKNDNNATSTTTRESNTINTTTKRKQRKIKGWVFRSTVQCSTYRPPTTKAPSAKGTSNPRPPPGEYPKDKGLTYHDFHLAMSIDVEVSREEVKRLLWSDNDQLAG